MYSIRSHFGSNRTNRTKPERRRRRRSLLPVLDESHVVSSELAADLLYRRIAPHQVSMNRNSWSFWVDDNLSRVEGKCLSELKSGGMIKWGKRMRVRYQSRHKESSRFKEEEEEETQGSDYSDQQKRKRKLVESRLAGKETQIVVYKRRSPNQFIDRWSIER